MFRLGPLFVLVAGLLAPAAELPQEILLLQRVRNRMGANLKQLPNYTCTQTIERYHRRKANAKPALTDTVRMEVALVDGKELFAWPGSNRFLEGDIRDLVPVGAIGNGDFALFAKTIFQTSAPQVKYIGEVEEGGRKLLRWDYTVSELLSGFKVRVNTAEAIVGFHGAFWVDAASLDVVRLQVIADQIPVHLQLESSSNTVEYGRVELAGGSFLLPLRSEMEMKAFRGDSSINRTSFMSCRHYSGESRLIFDDPEPEAKAAEPLRTLVAPEGIELNVAMETRVVAGQIAINDAVTAVLTKPAKIAPGIVAPKGAVLRGRVVWLSRQSYTRFPGYDLGLAVTELEWSNYRVSLRAQLENINAAMPQYYLTAPTPRQLERPRPQSATMGASLFFVRTNHNVLLERGVRMTWRTTKTTEDIQ